MLARLRRRGLPGDHDRRPRASSTTRATRCSTTPLARDVLCRTEGGDVYIGQVWPGDTAFPDFVTEEARAWWGELNAAHVRSGPRRDLERHERARDRRHRPATGCASARAAYSHERYHNQYALLMAMGTTEGLLEAMPDQRTFVLSRAGFAGIQRYAANWMGDNLSRWDHLWLSMPMAAGFGLSGQAFVGADIGGFIGDSSAELLRALDAVRRAHAVLPQPHRNTAPSTSTRGRSAAPSLELGPRRGPAALPPAAVPLRGVPARRRRPARPVQRPLVFDHQDDLVTRDIDDEYLLGPDLLVAPGRRSRARPPARSTCPRATGTTGTPASVHRRRPVRRRADADGPHPGVRARRRGRARVDRRRRRRPPGTTPTAIELHLFVPTADGEHDVLPPGGRRPDLRDARRRLRPHDLHRHPPRRRRSRCARPSTATASPSCVAPRSTSSCTVARWARSARSGPWSSTGRR